MNFTTVVRVHSFGKAVQAGVFLLNDSTADTARQDRADDDRIIPGTSDEHVAVIRRRIFSRAKAVTALVAECFICSSGMPPHSYRTRNCGGDPGRNDGNDSHDAIRFSGLCLLSHGRQPDQVIS